MSSSTYVKTDGAGGVIQYPYNLSQIMYDNPTVSFPMPMPNETAAVYNVYPVTDTPIPTYDPMTQNLVRQDPVYQSGAWVQQWAVEAATPQQQAQRLAEMRANLTCSPLQGKIELDNRGLLDDAEAIVAAADRTTQLAWANATIWLRTSPMIETLGAQLLLSPTDIDELFQAAQLIVV